MILMYHHLSPESEIPADPSRRRAEGWDFHCTPETFERHIAFLRKRGFTYVAFSEYVEGIQRTGTAPRRAVTVSFDDGWKDNPAHALPVLKAANVPAIFFLVSGQVEGIGADCFSGRDGVQALLDAGMEIGGHTRTHRPLARITLDEARTEILGNRDDLEHRYGVKIRHFAYPGGNFNRSVAEVVQREAGMESAVCVLPALENRRESLYWLSRETPAEPWGVLAKNRLIHPALRSYFAWKSRHRLELALDTVSQPVAPPFPNQAF
jgi:peptidoglycan/xylan/chitin deacetylase (PgdA/CDA1 family)